MRGAKHERGGHNRAWRNGAENFLHPRDGTPSVQAFQLCAGIVVAQDFAEGIALMSHYGGAYLAKANAVSPAFAVEPEGGRNAVGHTDVFHCEGAAFEVGGTQGAAYLQFLPDDEAALRAYYAEARNMSAGAGLEWFEAQDLAEVEFQACVYEAGKFLLGVFRAPAIENDWQGNPATKIFAFGAAFSLIFFISPSTKYSEPKL